MSQLVHFEALLPATANLKLVFMRLQQLGAQNTAVHPVTLPDISTMHSLRCVADHSCVGPITQALLTHGQATQVLSNLVESQQLVVRETSIPLGPMQKRHYCRVNEWLLGDEIVRAEPVLSDLQELTVLLGHSQEATRSDVMASWRKWRKWRVIEDLPQAQQVPNVLPS